MNLLRLKNVSPTASTSTNLSVGEPTMLNNQEINAPVLIENIGMKYQTLLSSEKRSFGIYKCQCGNLFEARIDQIKSIKSCGCSRYESIKFLNLSHGLSSHRLNLIWRSMKQRAYNHNNTNYNNYGGRGITVCDEWRNDFISFYDWAMSNGYDKSLSIDRINNDGNYEPSNCRWTTKEVQAQNKRVLRSNNSSGYKGVSFRKSRNTFVARISIDKKHIYIGSYFKTAYDAAIAYDKYVVDNNLSHSINGIYSRTNSTHTAL